MARRAAPQRSAQLRLAAWCTLPVHAAPRRPGRPGRPGRRRCRTLTLTPSPPPPPLHPAQLPHKSRETLRKQIIDMVLATDMKQHFAIHGAFQTKIAASNGGGGGTGNSGQQRLMSRLSGQGSDGGAAEGRGLDEDTRSLVLQVGGALLGGWSGGAGAGGGGRGAGPGAGIGQCRCGRLGGLRWARRLAGLARVLVAYLQIGPAQPLEGRHARSCWGPLGRALPGPAAHTAPCAPATRLAPSSSPHGAPCAPPRPPPRRCRSSAPTWATWPALGRCTASGCTTWRRSSSGRATARSTTA